MSKGNKSERQRRRKREKQRTRSGASQTRRLLSQQETSITGEASYIINRAQANDARVVTLGPLVFFSTQTGDAWMLDPGDSLALCLARDGETQPFKIIETHTQFGIEWTATYRIDGNLFIVTERSGQTRTIFGYPTEEISRAGHAAGG